MRISDWSSDVCSSDLPGKNVTTTLYGLKNCDTCRKARKWLDRFGVAHEFIDYRDEKPSPETLVEWARQAGGFDSLINKSRSEERRGGKECDSTCRSRGAADT